MSTTQAPSAPRAPARRRRDRTSAKAQRWLFAYVLTLFTALVGPAALTALWLFDETWRAETSSLWSLVAQVLPVLLLAIAVERRTFADNHAHGSLAAVVYVVVVGAAAVAELIAFVLLAYPCDTNYCADVWPSTLADVGTYFAAAAVPSALMLLILSGAIQSGLPFSGGGFARRRFQRLAAIVTGTAIALPITSVGLAAAAAGRLSVGVITVVLSALVGSRVRVREQRGSQHDLVSVELFGQTLALRTDERDEAEEDTAEDVATPPGEGRQLD